MNGLVNNETTFPYNSNNIQLFILSFSPCNSMSEMNFITFDRQRLGGYPAESRSSHTQILTGSVRYIQSGFNRFKSVRMPRVDRQVWRSDGGQFNSMYIWAIWLTRLKKAIETFLLKIKSKDPSISHQPALEQTLLRLIIVIFHLDPYI